jgi:uncharacterized protein (DUF2062 family)
MTALLVSLVVAALVVAALYAVIWTRWKIRDRKRRRERKITVECWHRELEREQRRLRLHVMERPYPEAPLASRRAR